MRVLYANAPFPKVWTGSIFLVGPTPRSDKPTPSWRPEALKILQELDFHGIVFVPEDEEGGVHADYLDQVSWEKAGLNFADVIVAWVPRDLNTMPSFTTNVEFGRWVTSGKMLYGRPDGSPKNSYLDWMAVDEGQGPVYNNLRELLKAAVERVGGPEPRAMGERHIPIHIWRAPWFQNWYAALVAAGNRLEDAKVLWTYKVGKLEAPFNWALKVKVWVAEEERYKENEWVLSRPDISSVVLYHHPDRSREMSTMEDAAYNSSTERLLDTNIVLIREFRSPVRNQYGYLHEIPGGSSWEGGDPYATAMEEVKEETGLEIEASRLHYIGSRQMMGTVSSHHAVCFSAELTAAELAQVQVMLQSGQPRGVVEDTERTYVEMATLRELVGHAISDWSTLGMIFTALSSPTKG